MELFTGQTPASHPCHRDRQVHLIEQREVRLTCIKLMHSQPSQRLTVSQVLPEMTNIGETVEFSDGALVLPMVVLVPVVLQIFVLL